MYVRKKQFFFLELLVILIPVGGARKWRKETALTKNDFFFDNMYVKNLLLRINIKL